MVPKKQNTHLTGFTIVELIVVMAIAAVLISVGVPSFTSSLQKGSVTREMNVFIGDLGFARAEAIKEGVTVTMCASSDGLTCSNANTWQTGWIIFPNANLAATTIVPLRKQAAFASKDTFVADNTTSKINFTSEGFTTSLPANPVTFKLQTTPVSSTLTQCVAINKAGRHIIQSPGTGNC